MILDFAQAGHAYLCEARYWYELAGFGLLHHFKSVLVIVFPPSCAWCGQELKRGQATITCPECRAKHHDDLPAMDNDDFRRGIPTCHKAFDEATAILAGDALLTLSFEILASEHTGLSGGHITDSKRLDVIRYIAAAAGFKGMISGQMMDMESQGKRLDSEALKVLHSSKTGALIEASVYSGAVLGGGNIDQIRDLASYGRSIGLAFQVADDILDIEGDPEVMGKATQKDAELDKSTYPSVIGLSESKRFADKLIHDALKKIESFGNHSDPLAAIARYIIERDR